MSAPLTAKSPTTEPWPVVPPLAAWEATRDTVHLWTQIVGKTRLATSPPVNHWWHVAFYVSARGIQTSPMPYGGLAFDVEFDFVDHVLRIVTSDRRERTLPLTARPVAEFYQDYLRTLAEIGIDMRGRIWPSPVEVMEAIRFDEDRVHAAYDADAMHRFWLALVQVDRVLKTFRGRFLGKASPVHFFWGGFDLAVTRFSGRAAPPHPGGIPHVGDWVMREAYSHEVSSCGFWAGSTPALPEAAFYAYAYPEPAGFKEAAVRPAAAYYHAQLGEFVLPYEVVRTAASPDDVLLAFLQSSYDAAADRAEWDRVALERPDADPRRRESRESRESRDH